MNTMLPKAAACALAALAIAAGLAAAATPLLADGQTPPRYRYPIYGWHGGYYDWGGPVAAGLLNSFAPIALLGPAWGWAPAYAPSYANCYWQNRPAYDGIGNFLGYAPVWSCY
jgi:hypothetical protein